MALRYVLDSPSNCDRYFYSSGNLAVFHLVFSNTHTNTVNHYWSTSQLFQIPAILKFNKFQFRLLPHTLLSPSPQNFLHLLCTSRNRQHSCGLRHFPKCASRRCQHNPGTCLRACTP
jgi:hypothetical protein